jgi:hypothetical protein
MGLKEFRQWSCFISFALPSSTDDTPGIPAGAGGIEEYNLSVPWIPWWHGKRRMKKSEYLAYYSTYLR